MERVKVLGLLGGIGSGKSTVGRMFADLGAELLDADSMAHACLDEPAVRERIARRFGSEVLDGDRRVDRKRLAARVFQSAADLSDLNAIVHPVVLAEIEQRLSALDVSRSHPLAVLDVPLLVESPALASRCDALVFVATPEADRLRRVKENRGWTAEDLAARESAQASLESKRAAARFVVENHGSLESTRRQVEAIYRDVAAGAPAAKRK